MRHRVARIEHQVEDGVLEQSRVHMDVVGVNGEFRVDVSNCNPTSVAVNVYKKLNELKGTSTADLNGDVLSNIVCDAVACLTDAQFEDGKLCIYFDTNGSKSD